MLAALKELFFGNHRPSKSLAKSRLHFVLVQDRTGLSSDELANFKHELLGVVEKYFVVDEKGFDICYKRELDLTTLVINSPVFVRRQEVPGHEVGARRYNRRQRRDNKRTQSPETPPETPPPPPSVIP